VIAVTAGHNGAAGGVEAVTDTETPVPALPEGVTMSTASVIVTLFAAAFVGFSAVSVFARAKWVVEPITSYGVPRAWWNWLGAAKAAGAAGLVAGLFWTPIGIAAAIGLVLYFLGAVVTVARARSYGHLVFPVLYLAPVVASLALVA